jgi:hypothetical protein
MKHKLVSIPLVALLCATTAWGRQDARPVPAPAPAVVPAANPIRPPAAPLTAAGLTQRWEVIGNLLERSSAARHIEKEGSAESKQLQQEARVTRAKAKEAIDAGELEKADALLREAPKLMFAAERASRSPALAAEKAKTDFVARRNSVLALLETGRRVSDEKHTTKPEFAKAEGLLKEADKFADDGKHAEGRGKLDQAYGLIKTALLSLRGGEELRAEKKFATKADEYKYEQARNDDYQGLIEVVIVGKDSSWSYAAELGKSLRAEAELLARNDNHDAALDKINRSTNQLKSLIRRAGVPII